jgi:ligand-binding sensor domain-containing protein/two-component sensor histidine kinase
MLKWLYSRILVFAVCLSIAYPTTGDQPRLTESRLSSLLHQPTVSAIHRDKRGILWIGTQQGLHRFDGANLTVFNADSNNKNRIPDSGIKDITEDHEGNLLVATSGGALLKLNSDTEIFESIAGSDQENQTRIIRLLASNQGSTWLLKRDGLVLVEPRFSALGTWVDNLNLLERIGQPYDFLEDKHGNIWIGGSLGLAKILVQQKSIVSFNHTELGISEDARVTALGKTLPGELIIGTDKGQLVLWDVAANKPLANAKIFGNAPHYISRFLLYEDTLIIGTDRGLFATDNLFASLETLIDRHDGNSNPNVCSLLLDGNYIWVGTIDGLDILSFAPFELFNENNSGVYNDVLSFGQDNEGRMWIGTYSGLYSYDEILKVHSKFDTDTTSSFSVDPRVAAISVVEKELWLGFLRGGVQAFSPNGQSLKAHNLADFNNMAVTKIMADNDNVWIATYDHGLFRVAGDRSLAYYDYQSLPEKSITLLFRSRTDIFLAVSESKVYQYDSISDSFNKIPFDFGLGNKQPIIYSFAQSKSDDILVGTKDHGLFIWPRKSQINNQFSLTPANKETSLSTSTIYGIELDSEGNLWCSTQNGIVKLDSNGHLIKRFTTAEGLQSNDFTFGSSFTSREGLIYFGGANGYNRFNPAEIKIDSSASPMRLTAIHLPGEENKNLAKIADLQTLQLTHKDHFVTFQFSVLDFMYPDRNQFRYKLENFDPVWIENGARNTATYTNLPAGNYVFRVQGANSAGIWNREGITLNVRVLPPPWFTWWALCAYAAIFLCLVWIALRIYRSYIIEQRSIQLAQEMFEAENRAEDDMQEQLELQDEIIQSAYRHNLTTLSLLNDCISQRSFNQVEEFEHDLAEQNIKQIAALSILEDCLYFHTGDQVADIKKYTDNILLELLKRTPVHPETIVTINEVTPVYIAAQLASPLSIVILELLENCFQHAFSSDSPVNYIHIRMDLGDGHSPETSYISLTVSDNGMGISRSIEDLACQNSGIAIVHSMVHKLGGTLEFASVKGTRVSISIPDPEHSILAKQVPAPT